MGPGHSGHYRGGSGGGVTFHPERPCSWHHLPSLSPTLRSFVCNLLFLSCPVSFFALEETVSSASGRCIPIRDEDHEPQIIM